MNEIRLSNPEDHRTPEQTDVRPSFEDTNKLYLHLKKGDTAQVEELAQKIAGEILASKLNSIDRGKATVKSIRAELDPAIPGVIYLYIDLDGLQAIPEDVKKIAVQASPEFLKDLGELAM